MQLNTAFNKIKDKGWIKSEFDKISGVGQVFEKELGIAQNNRPIADYNGIELKCKTWSSKQSLGLFSATFDGDNSSEIERIFEKYNYSTSSGEKILCFDASGKYKNQFGDGYSAKLNVNYNQNKIQLEIYKDGLLIDNEASWSFTLLKEKINKKLANLAYVTANSIKKKDGYYYKYEKIQFFTLISFEKFLYLIESGYIYARFKIAHYKSGKKKDEIHNHGISFNIRKERLNYLFNEIKLDSN